MRCVCPKRIASRQIDGLLCESMCGTGRVPRFRASLRHACLPRASLSKRASTALASNNFFRVSVDDSHIHYKITREAGSQRDPRARMEVLFADFAAAHHNESGYLLASTLSPEPPQHDPARLYAFQRSSNAYSIQTDLKYQLQYNPNLKLPKAETTVWLEIFTAFYKFVGTLLAAEEAKNAGREREANWMTVYEAWKEVVNALLRGYQSGALLAWTIPCLYVAGKYLRIFAIKADDAAASQRDSGVVVGALQEEDAFGSGSKNQQLEDAARQINRIFGVCNNDR